MIVIARACAAEPGKHDRRSKELRPTALSRPCEATEIAGAFTSPLSQEDEILIPFNLSALIPASSAHGQNAFRGPSPRGRLSTAEAGRAYRGATAGLLNRPPTY